MAKLTRVFQKIFSSEAALSQVAQFGSFAEGSPMKTKDPTAIQGLASWAAGWYSAVRGAYSPTIQDMNGVLLVLSYQLAYLFQQGISEWNSETTYYQHSLVTVSGVTYICIGTDTNGYTNIAVTNAAVWAAKGRGLRTVTATGETILSSDEVVLVNTALGSTFTTNLPQASACKGARIAVSNIGEGVCSIAAHAGDLIVGSATLSIGDRYTSRTLVSDGTTNWYLI